MDRFPVDYDSWPTTAEKAMNWFNIPTVRNYHGRVPEDSGVLMCLNRHCDQPAAPGLESGLCVRHEADRLDEAEAEVEDRMEMERRTR